MVREFYPMLSRTLKSLLKIPPKDVLADYIKVIVEYPNYTLSTIDARDGVMAAVLDELKRQYDRWNKVGGEDAE